MNRSDRHPCAGSGLPVFLGLLVSQVMATGIVRQANRCFQIEMTAVIAGGYVAVPSPGVVADLSRWTHAFIGGLFFTLTTGSLITLGTLVALRLTQCFSWSVTRQAGILAALWAVLTVWLNGRGLNPGATFYVSAVMAAAAVAVFCVGRHSGSKGRGVRRIVLIVTPLVLLAGLWLTRLDRDLFVDIRDRLLFSNPAGAKIGAFYYDYTLFAVQAMAPLSHRTLIGVDMSPIKDDPLYRELSQALRRADVLDIGNLCGAAAIISPEGRALRWQDAAGRSLVAGRVEVLKTPGAVVQKFSLLADTAGPFRRLTLAGILVGFPVILYLAGFVSVEKLLGLFSERHATWAAALVCLAVGGALFYPLAAAPADDIHLKGDRHRFRDGAFQENISWLRQAARSGLDPLQHPGAERFAHSPRLAERYWFARALAGSRPERGYGWLLRMVDDSSPIVSSQACYALGEMKDPRAIPVLLDQIQDSGHWYTQRYAYAALRKLGWIQPGVCR